MLTIPVTNLGPFDQAQLDKRFLVELDRLLQAETFATYAQWAATVQVSANYVNAIASGRYHASLKLLYSTLRHYPAFDFSYVVFGSAVHARPEPETVPVRVRGRRPKAVAA